VLDKAAAMQRLIALEKPKVFSAMLFALNQARDDREVSSQGRIALSSQHLAI
jgi:hypothetical protein